MLHRPPVEEYMPYYERYISLVGEIIAGHEMHHLQVIQNKYLGKFKHKER